MPLSRWLAAPPTGESAKPPTPWREMLTSTILGGCVSYVGIKMVMDAQLVRELVGMAPIHTLAFAAVAIVLVWLALLVHEVGHLLGGWLGGLRPFLLLAGPLRVNFEDRGAAFRYNGEISTWGGLALALPRGEQVERRAVAMMVGGGPGASVVLAGAAWMMPAEGLMTQGWLSLLWITSSAIAMGTLLPMSMGGYVSDGSQLLQLLLGSPDSVHRLELAAVAGQSAAGQRPRQWPVKILEKIAEAAQAPQLRTSALLMKAQCEDDRHPQAILDGEHPAYRAFEALAFDLHHGGLVNYPKAFRAALLLPVATFLGQRMGEAAAASDWLQSSEGGIAQVWERLHARAALAWAEGDPLRARTLAAQALDGAARSAPDGNKIMACERLKALSR